MVHRSLHDLPVEDRYHRGHVQTFYAPFYCSYFKVDIPIPNSTPIFDIYMKDEASSYPQFNVTIPAAPREIPPLLYQTQWHIHLADHLTDKAKRRTLSTLVTPKDYTKNALWKLVWNYVAAVSAVAQQTTMRIRCLLKEYPR
jgi:hypothetical protein